MKIVRFSADGRSGYGILEGQTVRALAGTPYGRLKTTGLNYKLGDIRLLAPCRPSKIVALGGNYRSHGEEMDHHLPTEPLLFIKPPTAATGPEGSLTYPATSGRGDH